MLEEEASDVWEDLSNIPADPPQRREICSRCRRPMAVCWCSYLPAEPVDITSTVIILQHPGEEKRCLRTAPMLEFALPAGQFHLFKGRRFSSQTSHALKTALASPQTLLLYPGPNAVSLDTYIEMLPNREMPHTIIILDGTWPQARSLFTNSEEIQKLKQVQIHSNRNSEYVIRTQPTEGALSTVETAALALSALEKKPHLRSVLVRPLKALCGFQLAHGAVTHHSKEYLIKNGEDKCQKKPHFLQQEYLV